MNWTTIVKLAGRALSPNLNLSDQDVKDIDAPEVEEKKELMGNLTKLGVILFIAFLPEIVALVKAKIQQWTASATEEPEEEEDDLQKMLFKYVLKKQFGDG